MLTSEELEKLWKAGEIASKVRERVPSMVKPNMRILDLCEMVEADIRGLGGQPAFPCNVDINHVGAHYTASIDDVGVIPPDSIVKVDIGVHVDGYIGDTAVSICLNPEMAVLKQATDEALTRAIRAVRADVKVSEIGSVIQHAITQFGLKPIRNLTGHSISRFTVHAGKHIPNIASADSMRVLEGEVYAIEPFATTVMGEGLVANGGPGFIYRQAKGKPPKEPEQQRLFEYLRINFQSLPFASRWLFKSAPMENCREVFNLLLQRGYVQGYPILVEARNKPVGQSEHTLIVTRQGCEVTTA